VLDGKAAGASHAVLRRVRSTAASWSWKSSPARRAWPAVSASAYALGDPTRAPEKNAHPHISGGVSVVHNGIIENHEEMRKRLRAKGYEFVSDTDTEVIAHLVHSNLQSGAALFDAVKKSVIELVGAYGSRW